MPRKKKSIAPRVEAGTLVLLGKPGISMPSDWFMAKVLWADHEQILTEHAMPASGDPYRQVFHVSHIRGHGNVVQLNEYRRRCQRAAGDRVKRVRDLESALGVARRNVWAKLDEIAAAPFMGLPEEK